MADDTEDAARTKAHAELVKQRSSIIEALAKGYQQGQTENQVDLLVKIQTAIDILEALDDGFDDDDSDE